MNQLRKDYQPSLTFDFVESLLQSCKLASTRELDDDLYPLSPGLFLRLVFGFGFCGHLRSHIFCGIYFVNAIVYKIER